MGIVSDTRALSRGREYEVLAALGISPPKRGHMRCPLGVHPDRSPSWRWNERIGRYHCTCGGGDLLDLVMQVAGLRDVVAAAGYVREVLGLPPLGKRRAETPEQKAVREAQLVGARRLADERRAQMDRENAEEAARQLAKARAMWDRSIPIQGTPADIYLRRRGITCPLPATLRGLPPRHAGEPGAMIAAFALADELDEPGVLSVHQDTVQGVHLTFVNDEGQPVNARIDEDSLRKVTVGQGHNIPIVLAAPNDRVGLAITEGIEEALTAYQATGLGAWAAGTANRLPGLAAHIPDYIESVTIIQDADDAGRKYSPILAKALVARYNLEVRIVEVRNAV